MSSPLAMAGVTAVLKDLLNDGLINNDLASIGTFTVSALPPDRIQTGANEENRLNIFLYQVTPNQGWRNQGLPSTGFSGERLTNPPLALDLHYMLSAYGRQDLNAEVLLGYAMEALHDTPVLSRADIRKSLSAANPVNINLIPADEDGRTADDLADQIEQIKITPSFLSADELSRLWTAMQARYRPTMAYQVTTVLIQRRKPTRSPLPVLTRGKQDSGINSQPDLKAPAPTKPTLKTLIIREPLLGLTRDAAELGDALVLEGAMLAGAKVTAIFSHKLLDAPLERPAKLGATATRVEIDLPKDSDANASRDWPAGVYSVSLLIERTGKPAAPTNVRSFALVPRISAAPVVTGGPGNASVTVKCFPEVRKNQRVELFVGGVPFKPAPLAGNASTLTIPLTGIAPFEGPIPLELRVDDVDSILVRDTTAKPPQFEPQQTIVLPL